MLAQQFLSHDALGIEQVDRDALIAVLGMLERKELVHWRDPDEAPISNGFNMAALISGRECGTVGCICGWAHVASRGRAFQALAASARAPDWSESISRMPEALKDLFGFGLPDRQLCGRTVTQSAEALRNYLTTGDAQWDDVLTAAG
jgi:hypothetical protein